MSDKLGKVLCSVRLPRDMGPREAFSWIIENSIFINVDDGLPSAAAVVLPYVILTDGSDFFCLVNKTSMLDLGFSMYVPPPPRPWWKFWGLSPTQTKEWIDKKILDDMLVFYPNCVFRQDVAGERSEENLTTQHLEVIPGQVAVRGHDSSNLFLVYFVRPRYPGTIVLPSSNDCADFLALDIVSATTSNYILGQMLNVSRSIANLVTVGDLKVPPKMERAFGSSARLP